MKSNYIKWINHYNHYIKYTFADNEFKALNKKVKKIQNSKTGYYTCLRTFIISSNYFDTTFCETGLKENSKKTINCLYLFGNISDKLQLGNYLPGIHISV